MIQAEEYLIMALTKEEIKKFEKLQDKAGDNTEMNSYCKDDEEYY